MPRRFACRVLAKNLNGYVVQANGRKLAAAFLARFLLGRLNP
jgi:hypothetical protein